ncbi:MAG: HTH domain-containing protein [Clostridia bacterium]|nr:HTH domain-containing protein [Clostridia bacterium]
MRTSRILEMIYLLLNNRQQKAQDIANHFGVSTKTIYRDVETLAEAGIPISMQQGVDGGIVLSEHYAINKTKLTASEEKVLMKAIDDIKKLPNAQLDYALKLLKQYFNEAGTMWINTNDIALDIHDKFHLVKAATIEKRVIEFDYFIDRKFVKHRVEPYELRNDGEIWTLIVRHIKEGAFEEIYLTRMKNIQVKSKHFSRRDLPDQFGKKYDGEIKVISFVVEELTDDLLNRFPIECFEFNDDSAVLNVKVKEDYKV